MEFRSPKFIWAPMCTAVTHWLRDPATPTPHPPPHPRILAHIRGLNWSAPR